jgi:DNA-binding transcriptional LysR family regulator
MVGRRVAELPQVTVASPAYLEAYGEPKDLSDLAAHRAVNYVSSATGKPVPLEFSASGYETAIVLPSIVSVTGTDLYTGAAVAGLGIVQVPRYRVAGEVADGRLKIILAHFPPPPMPVSVLYPQNRQLSSRVRVFAQWLRDIFEAAAPAIHAAPAPAPASSSTRKKALRRPRGSGQ